MKLILFLFIWLFCLGCGQRNTPPLNDVIITPLSDTQELITIPTQIGYYVITQPLTIAIPPYILETSNGINVATGTISATLNFNNSTICKYQSVEDSPLFLLLTCTNGYVANNNVSLLGGSQITIKSLNEDINYEAIFQAQLQN